MELREVGGAAVGEHDAPIAAIVRLAHCGVDADFGGDAADQQMLDAEIAQQRVEISAVKRALARLVDHRLAGQRTELGNDVVARLAADQYAAHRAGRADAHRGMPALDLGFGRVGKIGAVALAGVDHQQAGLARRVQHGLTGRNRAAKQRDIVAERLAKAARLEEIALHVYDDQRRARQVERDRFGLRMDGRAHHNPPIQSARSSKIEAMRPISANMRIRQGFRS